MSENIIDKTIKTLKNIQELKLLESNKVYSLAVDDLIKDLSNESITTQQKKIEELEEERDFHKRAVGRLQTRLTERLLIESSLTAYKDLLEKLKETSVCLKDWIEDKEYKTLEDLENYIKDMVIPEFQAIEDFEKELK